MKFISLRVGFDLMREYAGGLLKSGMMAVHKNNKIYFGATDKKTVRILTDDDLTLQIDGGSASTVYDTSTYSFDGGNANG